MNNSSFDERQLNELRTVASNLKKVASILGNRSFTDNFYTAKSALEKNYLTENSSIYNNKIDDCRLNISYQITKINSVVNDINYILTTSGKNGV